MNHIKAVLDKSDHDIYDDFLNIQIDGFWLDEKLDQLYPKRMYKGLIPTLLFPLESEQENEVVWHRILPSKNSKEICPILMCPDDCDFSCTLIVVEIIRKNDLIVWNRMGIDRTLEYEAIKVGSKVEWLDKFKTLRFDLAEYQTMIERFKNQQRH